MTSGLVEHLESYLGEIGRGWGDSGDIKVIEFPDQPMEGVVTYATLGLSSTALPMSEGRTVRQEFLVSVNSSFEPERIASFLSTFAEYVRGQDQALLRGDVVGPSVPVIPGVRAVAVYASIPVFFDDDLAAYEGTSPPTVFVWLIPLPAEDAEFVKSYRLKQKRKAGLIGSTRKQT